MSARPGMALCSCFSRAVRRAPLAVSAAGTAPSSSSSKSSRSGQRALHTRPNLPYEISQGVEPFLSPKALHGTAVDWHQGCLDRLNDLTRGTKFENKSVANTVIEASKERQDAMIFGYASEALNNGFFLSCLKPTSSGDASIEEKDIKDAVTRSFGSVTSFINYFSSYANGIFGTGYVWLVMDSVDNLAVVATYGSGTVLVQGNRIRAPELEPFLPAGETAEGNTGENAPSDAANAAAVQAAQEAIGHETERQPTRTYENDASSQSASGLGQSRAMHTSAIASAPPAAVPIGAAEAAARSTSYLSSNIGQNMFASSSPRRSEPKRFMSIHPLLCLSLHPHVYIPDYGVWGKEQYIQNFWKSVDWQKADQKYRAVKEIYGGHIKKDTVNPILW